MHYSTRYELLAISPDGGRYLAGYCRVPSKASAIRMIRQNADAWIKLLGNSPFMFSGKGRMGWALNCNGWEIRFSHRTKLEASNSELPFFKTAINY